MALTFSGGPNVVATPNESVTWVPRRKPKDGPAHVPLLLVVALIGGTVLVGRQLRRAVRNGRRTGDRPRAA